MSVLCYNRGCGQTYDPKENAETSCTHHPGMPFFHETYKGWTCCNKKSTDFTEFLNIKGCSVAKHSNDKPPEPEKPQEIIEAPVVEEIRAPVYVPKERPSSDEPLIALPQSVNNGLAKTLESLSISAKGDEEEETIKPGTSCKNKGCKTSYLGPQSNALRCLHHEGAPIFHEGLKYWTCCQRKTTDFDAFLDQAGCIEGKHMWLKPKSETENVDKAKSCRFDWHQTGSHVCLAIYSKVPIPELSHITANQVKLNVSIIFGVERQEFASDFKLFGVIDLKQSKVSFLGSKVEISLKKAEPVNWLKLSLPEDD